MLETYWANVNWTGIAALLTSLAALSAPFWANRTSALATKAKRSETEIERLERREREQYERTERRAEQAEKEARDCRAECDDCRNQSLGMEEWAHWYRHEATNVQQRFCNLVDVIEREVAGGNASDWFRKIVEQTRARMPTSPPSVPRIHDADKIKPPVRPTQEQA